MHDDVVDGPRILVPAHIDQSRLSSAWNGDLRELLNRQYPLIHAWQRIKDKLVVTTSTPFKLRIPIKVLRKHKNVA